MKTKANFLISAILLFLATILILSSLNILPEYISDVIFTWKSILLAAGCIFIINGNYWTGSIITLFAFYLLIPTIYHATGYTMPVSEASYRNLFFAIGLIGIALYLIFKPSLNKYSIDKESFRNTVSSAHFNNGSGKISCVFGDINHTVIEKPLKNMNISTAFGSLKIDMLNTSLPEGESLLNVSNAFGETIITVPESWNIEHHINTIVGEFDDLRTYIPKSGSRKLIIRGSNAFGGVKIRSARAEEVTVDEVYEEDEAEKIETITVKQNNRLHIISLDELMYLQAEGDYVSLFTSKGTFLKEQTMKYFQNALPSDKFIRIHRSYIVNLSEISSIDTKGKESYYATLKNGVSLRASASGIQELKQKLEL